MRRGASSATGESSPVRLLLVTDSLEVGGAERHVVDLAVELAQGGYEVAVACSVSGSLGKPLVEADVPVIPLLDRKVKRRVSLAYAFRLRRLVKGRQFDLVHAHNAVPAGDAVRRSNVGPMIVSVHGGDVFFTARRWPEPVRRGFSAASLVLANSAGVAELSRSDGAGEVRVVRLGTDIPAEIVRGDGRTVVTVGHLVARKRHDDVIRALPDGIRYEVVGDGPERPRLEALAREHGADVVFHGQLPHAQALEIARRCDVFAMPSTDEAFGVAYVEAMAGGLPAIGRRGEPGPEEIAGLGGGMLLTTGGDLREQIGRALEERDVQGLQARATVEEHFTWARCGRETFAAYEHALAKTR